MNTQILKMDRPYNYIFCNGHIGLHIATMIVYETKTNKDGGYELETHSHPIVKYSNTPGGTVWNKAELTDCIELCDEEKKAITLRQYINLLNVVQKLLPPNESVSPTSSSTDALMEISEKLYDYQIEVEWPILHYTDEQAPQDYFLITLIFDKNPKGSLFKYSCYDYGTSDVKLVGGVDLPFRSEFNTKEELKRQLVNCVLNYYSIFNDQKFTIEFSSFDDNEFEDVIDEVNKMEPELRKESDEIDV